MSQFDGHIALFFGCGSEYVMSPLVSPFKSAGFEVVELDVLKNPQVAETLLSIKATKQPVTFVNSAPMLVDRIKFAKNNADLVDRYYSGLAIIKYLRPRKSVFMPHDLINPVVGRDILYLRQFDLYISCDDYTSRHGQQVKTLNAGWIRHWRNLPENQANTKTSVWFLSNYASIFGTNINKGIDLCAPIMDQGVAIKLPVWTGVEKVEQQIMEAGYKVVPATADNFQTMHEYNTILVNDMSSVGWEAHLYGKPVVIMGISKRSQQRYHKMLKQDNFCIINNFHEFNLSACQPPAGRCQLKPFNFDMLLNALI